MSLSINQFIQALRLKEVAILSGFFMIGSAFGIHTIDSHEIVKLGLVLFISTGIVSSLYSLNAYTDNVKDEINPRLDSLKKVSRQFFLWYFIVSLPVFLACSFTFHYDFGLLTSVLALVGTLYSLPRFGLKNNPLLGTVAHFLFSVTAFNAGYAAFQDISLDSFYLSCYFGLIFSGGHLHHQVIDYESDLKSSVKTLAVWWGVARTEFGSLILFTLAAVVWIGSLYQGRIGKEEFVPLFVAYLIQATTFIRYRNGSYQDRIDYRSGYRFLYLSAFVLVAVLRLWKL